MGREEKPRVDWLMECFAGCRMKSAEAHALEQELLQHPDNPVLRVKLLGYYCIKQGRIKGAGDKHAQQALWVLTHAPGCGLGNTPYLRIEKEKHPDAYRESKKLILDYCEQHADNAELLCNLGAILSADEPEVAARILRRAHSVSSSKAETAFWLARCLRHWGRRDNDVGLLIEATSVMDEAVRMRPRKESSVALTFFVAVYAFDSRQFDLAAEICNRMLELADSKPDDGQLPHTAHILLGRICLLTEDVAGARAHLIAAGRVKSSPRLGSYGPMMELANELLVRGERDCVIQFLQDCSTFWDGGERKLKRWREAIRNGRTPQLKGDEM